MSASGVRRGGILAAAALVVVLAIAGIVSGFASGSPDGLERVAEDQGFADAGRDGEAIGPLDGYAVNGDDSRLGTGVAGVAGSVIVLLLAGGLAYGVRRRGASADDSGTDLPGTQQTASRAEARQER